MPIYTPNITNSCLEKVLHVPRIALNLVFVHKFCLHNNCSCHFDANELKIQDIPMGGILYWGLSENGVYPIYSQHFRSPPSAHIAASTHLPRTAVSTRLPSISSAFHAHQSKNWLLWHHRLGHPSDKVLSSALSSYTQSVVSNKNEIVTHCKHCLSDRMHELPFDKSNFISSQPLELVHSDVWGPSLVMFVNDFRYFLVFADDFTKFIWTYLLKYESDVSSINLKPLLSSQPRLIILSLNLLPSKLLLNTLSGVLSWMRSLKLYKGRELGVWFPLPLYRM